jgi:hypothetical protein
LDEIMTQELTLIGTFLGIVAVLLLMFMPTLMELKRPQDAGPRLIPETFAVFSTPAPKPHPVLIDLEGEAQTIMTYERFIGFLPNLESAFSE